MEKTCTTCGETKPVEMFQKGRNKCKSCLAAQRKAYLEANREKVAAQKKAHYEANREKLAAQRKAYKEANREKVAAYAKAYAKAYYEANREKLAAQDKSYREANQEKERARKKAYYEANREKVAAQRKAYKEANREKLAVQRKAYYEANREKVLARTEARRVAKAVMRPIVNRLMVQQRGKCAVCHADILANFHVDHILPLALGGTHDEKNLQLLCPSCNLKKHAKHPVEFMQQQGKLL